MSLEVVPGEVFDLGNHKAVEATLRFSGTYPAGGYECVCGRIGLTEVCGVIPLHGQDGIEFSYETHVMQAYIRGHECVSNELDGMNVTFLFVGH